MTDASDPPAGPADVARDHVQAQAERVFGGRHRLDAALGWAAGSLDAADRDRLNQALAADPGTAGRALGEIRQRYDASQQTREQHRLASQGIPQTRRDYEALRSRAMRGDATARRTLSQMPRGLLAKFYL